MKIRAILLSVLISTCAFSQPPAPQDRRTRADSLMDEGNMMAAIAEYEKLFTANPRDASVCYNYARALSVDNLVIKNFDKCFQLLNLSIELDSSDRALTEPSFIAAREDSRWPLFEDRLIMMLHKKDGTTFKDLEYAKALWKLGAYDQAFFDQIMIAQRKLGMRSSVASSIWKLKMMIQEKNQAELEKLVAAKGWPSTAAVGRQAFMAAYLVAMHTNDGGQKKYLPLIKQKCEEKELPWVRYANIYDRCLFNEKKPQHFGTHTRYNETTGKEELYPLEDETKVDQWRKEIGLEPLADYLSRFNITFKPGK